MKKLPKQTGFSLRGRIQSIFSFELDDSYNVLWNRYTRYLTSGNLRLNYFNDLKFGSDDNESYLTYLFPENHRDILMSRFLMDCSGQFKQLHWQPRLGCSSLWSQPRQQCEVFCGGKCHLQ